jgi:hypothetical protein
MTVTPQTHAKVLYRDGQCVAALLDKSHICRDTWNVAHDPRESGVLTVEHVRSAAGARRKDDAYSLIAMCYSGNVIEHWGSANRDLCRAYLAGVLAQSGVLT